MTDPRVFYDALSDDYHLLFEDWDASIRRQGQVIDALLGGGSQRVLDIACGIGTQALGLAQLGHRVTARDLSPEMVRRARDEALRRGLSIALSVEDMRKRVASEAGRFDAVIAFDNALPHLPTDADLHATMEAAHAALRGGGRFLASVRDYDRLAVERPMFDPPRRLGVGANQRIVLQIWDWEPDGRGYRFEHLILLARDNGAWEVRSRTARYRALRRHELEEAAASAGFTDPRWLAPEESGFYQPIFTALKAT